MDRSTIFENRDIDISGLPQLEASTFNPLDPRYKTILILSAVLLWAILFVGALIAAPMIDLPFLSSFRLVMGALLLCIVLGLLHISLINAGFGKKGYAIRRLDLSYKTGLINRRVVTIPYSRIQHVDVRQGALERAFDLAKLNIYTAGGQGSDLSVPGLTFGAAQNLKAYILKAMSADEEE